MDALLLHENTANVCLMCLCWIKLLQKMDVNSEVTVLLVAVGKVRAGQMTELTEHASSLKSARGRTRLLSSKATLWIRDAA